MCYAVYTADDADGLPALLPVPRIYNINWEVLHDVLDWQTHNVGQLAVPLRLTANCVVLNPSSTMSMSLVLKTFDEINIEALRKLAVSSPNVFSTCPWGLIYYLEDCTELRRCLLDCHGKLKYGVERDVRIGRLWAIYAKWVNMVQVFAELWGPDNKSPRAQNIHFFQAKELVLTFIAPITLQTLLIAITGLVGTINRMRDFFELPDSVRAFLEVATTGTCY
jgi:hypothetical protein